MPSVGDCARSAATILVRERCSGLHRCETFLCLSRVADFSSSCQHATYSIDSDNNVIVGLPPPREGWVTARSYCLEESLADRALHVRLTLFCFDLHPELFFCSI
jgi:hypothetical protein